MLVLVAGFLLARQADVPLMAGDRWNIERTYRYLNEAEAIDFTQVERTEYSVDNADAKGYVLSVSRRITANRFGKDEAKTVSDPHPSKLTLGPGGAPSAMLESEDAIRTRVDRIQWAAAEDRRGVSWTRRFDASVSVQSAKVTVKPTAVRGSDKTVSITYDESDIHGEAVAVISGAKRIVTSLKLTLTNVYPPNGDKKVKLAVNQSLVP